jgi:hypothetical protein
MALGLFIAGVDTVEDVIAIRTTAINLLKEGSTTTSWSSEGTSVTKTFTLPVRTVLEECNWFLSKYDPATYGRKVKRTSAYFTS